jgi:hypothetical protein
MSDNLLTWIVLIVVGITVIRTVYKHGYQQGQVDLVNPPQPTEADRDRVLMKITLPWWRRVGGWVAIAAPCVLFWVLMFGAVRYGGGSGWAFFGACLLFFVLLIAGVGLSEWFWKPFRKAQEEMRQVRAGMQSADASASNEKR